MKIKEILLDSYGKFNHKKIIFDDKINVLYGDNEAGKSTISSFLISSLFLEDSKTYKTYKPFNSDEFNGNLKASFNNKDYLFKINFNKQELNVIDEDKKEVLNKNLLPFSFGTGKKQNNPGIGLTGIGLSVFNETFFLNQSAFKKIGNESTQEVQKRQNDLKNALQEAARTKSSKLNIENVLKKLTLEKQKISSKDNFEQNFNKTNEIGIKNLNLRELFEKKEELLNQKTKQNAFLLEKQKNYEQLKASEKRESELFQILKLQIEARNFFYNEKLKALDLNKNVKVTEDEFHLASKFEEQKAKRKLRLTLFSILIPLFLLFPMFLGFINKFLFSLALLFVVSVPVAFFIHKKLSKKLELKKNPIFVKYNCFTLGMLETLKNTENINLSEKELFKSKINSDFGFNKGEFSDEKIKAISKEVDDVVLLQNELKIKINESEKYLNFEKLDEELLIVENEIKELIQQKNVLIKKYRALNLAIEVLTNEAQKIYNETIPLILNRIKLYNEKVIGGELYLRLDENYQIIISDKNGNDIPYESISNGTKDQFYFFLRLALIDVLDSEKKIPVILDDAFLEFDYDRLTKTLALLKDEDRQFFLFTHSFREKEIFDKLGIKHFYFEIKK